MYLHHMLHGLLFLFQPWCWLLSGCWKGDVRCGHQNVRRIYDLLIFWLFRALISNYIEVVCLSFRTSPALNLIIPGASESSSSWEGTKYNIPIQTADLCRSAQLKTTQTRAIHSPVLPRLSVHWDKPHTTQSLVKPEQPAGVGTVILGPDVAPV